MEYRYTSATCFPSYFTERKSVSGTVKYQLKHWRIIWRDCPEWIVTDFHDRRSPVHILQPCSSALDTKKTFILRCALTLAYCSKWRRNNYQVIYVQLWHKGSSTYQSSIRHEHKQPVFLVAWSWDPNSDYRSKYGKANSTVVHVGNMLHECHNFQPNKMYKCPFNITDSV